MRLLLAALALTACGEGLSPPYLIADLRILAVRAEPSEGPPGATIALDSLVMSPDPDEVVEQLWFACPALVGAAAQAMPCAAESALSLGTGPTASAVVPEGTTQLIVTTAAAPAASGGLEACLSGFMESGAIPSGCRIALKRVNVVSDAAAANRNPTVAVPTIAGERVTVEASDPDADEGLFLSWFVTAGELDKYRTDVDAEGLENQWTPASEPGRVIVVVRDGEGGEAWSMADR
jgi:hypothetical protein